MTDKWNIGGTNPYTGTDADKTEFRQTFGVQGFCSTDHLREIGLLPPKDLTIIQEIEWGKTHAGDIFNDYIKTRLEPDFLKLDPLSKEGQEKLFLEAHPQFDPFANLKP